MINSRTDQNLSGVLLSVLYTVLGGGVWELLIPCNQRKSGALVVLNAHHRKLLIVVLLVVELLVMELLVIPCSRNLLLQYRKASISNLNENAGTVNVPTERRKETTFSYL